MLEYSITNYRKGISLGIFDKILATPKKKDRRKIEIFLYEKLAFYFHLPDEYRIRMSRGERTTKTNPVILPIDIRWDNGYIDFFSIRSSTASDHEGIAMGYFQFFMRDNSINICNHLDRDISLPQSKQYAYDFSKIQQGLFSAKLVDHQSIELMTSNETRALLGILDEEIHVPLKDMPLVELTLGDSYLSHGVPKEVHLQIPLHHSLFTEERDAIVERYVERYGIYENKNISVNISHKDSRKDSTNSITFSSETVG